MTLDSRGHDHLTSLLGHAEQVVRITPASILVLTGVSDDVPMEYFAHIGQMLTEAGVEARGIMALGKGVGVDSIDLEQILAQDQAARSVSPGENIQQSVGTTAVNANGVCPICEEIIPIPVRVTIQAVGEPPVLSAVAHPEQADLGMHSLMCRGKPGEDV